MFYQHFLLKKKGQFGIIWLAAHCPSKLSKHDVLSLNLALKCKEISEFVNNGQHKKPRFSLQLSSHLMYGLVVLLSRQLNYLYSDMVAFQSELKPVIFKQPTKTPKKARKVDKSALAIKENLPEDLFDLDLSFQMPMELPFEVSIPNDRIRDITLSDTDVDRLELMHPIPMNKSMMDVDLPPLPSEFMPSSIFGKDESTAGGMLTSTVRKPTDNRTPLGEIDLNRQKDNKGKKRPLSGVEDTFQAIRRIAEEDEIMEPQYDAVGIDPSHMGETLLQPIGGRELFDITGIMPHASAALVEQTDDTLMPAAPELNKTAAASLLLKPMKKVKLAPKKKLLVDEVKEIPDKEMQRRLKHQSEVQQSDIERVTVFNKLPFVDLFRTNNRDMRRPFVSKIERNLNIQTKYIESNYETFNIQEPFYDASRTMLPEEEGPTLQPDMSDRNRESGISRRRAGTSSIMGAPEQLSTIGAPESPQKQAEAFPEPQHHSEVMDMPQTDFMMAEIPEPFLPPTETIQSPAKRAIEEGSYKAEILNNINEGKKFFHEMLPALTTKKKKAAGMFASLLQMCSDKQVKVEQRESYGPIRVKRMGG